MITATGYSKDQSIMPEGIVVTFGKDMMEEQGGMELFLKNFEKTMAGYDRGDYWMHKMKNTPKFEFDKVYIIADNKLYGRVNFGGIQSNPRTGYSADGKKKVINWKRILLAGPLEKCPFERELKGFQGFRYCTKLF